MSAVWRSTVDLPAMFGPVMMSSSLRSWSRWTSLGTNRPGSRACSITGWRPSVMVR